MEQMPTDYLEEIRKVYQSRQGHQGWEQVRTLIPRLCGMWNIPWNTVLKGAENYRTYVDRQGKNGSDYVKVAANFFSDRDMLFAEYADKDMRTEQQIKQDTLWSDLDQRATVLGITLNRAQGYDYAMQGVLQAEKRAQNAMWEAKGMNLPKFKLVS